MPNYTILSEENRCPTCGAPLKINVSEDTRLWGPGTRVEVSCPTPGCGRTCALIAKPEWGWEVTWLTAKTVTAFRYNVEDNWRRYDAARAAMLLDINPFATS